MCGPLYILYRCGDRILRLSTFYCRFSTRHPTTGQRRICDEEWGEIEVCDNNKVCNRDDCVLSDKIRGGWRCCLYGHRNAEPGKTVCEGRITFPDGKAGRCWHLICPRCRGVDETGGSDEDRDADKERKEREPKHKRGGAKEGKDGSRRKWQVHENKTEVN